MTVRINLNQHFSWAFSGRLLWFTEKIEEINDNISIFQQFSLFHLLLLFILFLFHFPSPEKNMLKHIKLESVQSFLFSRNQNLELRRRCYKSKDLTNSSLYKRGNWDTAKRRNLHLIRAGIIGSPWWLCFGLPQDWIVSWGLGKTLWVAQGKKTQTPTFSSEF